MSGVTGSSISTRPATRAQIARVGSRYLTALRFLITEYLRNRTALILLVAFVPIWYWFMVLIVGHDPLAFRMRATGQFLSVDSQQLSLITAGLNALTLITGFLVFSATKRGMTFDRRLVICGYPQRILLAAKLTGLVLASAALTIYSTLILLAFWHGMTALPAVMLGLFVGAFGYAALGMLLGILVRGELEGFFVVIMLSLIDTFLQNPLGNPVANQDFLQYFPSFGPTQVAVAGGFTHTLPWTSVGVALIWPAAFAVLAVAVFWWRTRVPREYEMPSPSGQ